MMFPTEKTFKPDQYLGLSVEKPEIPDFVRHVANENHLNEKPECHISVLVSNNAVQAWRTAASASDPEMMRGKIQELFNSYAWEYSLTSEYFLHEHTYTKDELVANGEDVPEHTRRSIVVKVSLPDLSRFYEKLNEMLGLSLPLPVPHVTLFAWSDYEPYRVRGIGICSREEFDRFTKQKITP
ncbi:MAG TPA: hypothetical protein VJH91_00835 [Candidatus Paceibacterota bacterium]